MSVSSRFARLTLILLLVSACSSDEGSVGSANELAEPTEAVVHSAPRSEGTAGTESQDERRRDERPSVILIVVDTLRADAVSSYGTVENTTPHFDRLAAKGLRYEHAYAPAPWTAASHASLFTGLRVDQHGVGLDGLAVVPDSFEMLAEDFQDAGYATAGFSANSVIDEDFGFERGFDSFESPDLMGGIDARRRGQISAPFQLLDRIHEWNRQRDRARPYFLFVNIFDAHDPYEVHDSNAWSPKEIAHSEIEYVASRYEIPRSLCDGVPTRKHLEILRGLYLGDVASADAKLGEILRILEKGDEATPRIVVATSDHGEHLGENRLMGHRFSVRNATLQIPMVVVGVPDTEPTIIDLPVELRSLRSSLLCWALGQSCASSLPTTAEDRDPQALAKQGAIFSLYSDSVVSLPDWMRDRLGISREEELPSLARAKCRRDEPVFGDMVSMIRYPMKITWFSESEPVLHDLRWDTAERSNQMERQPELAATLLAEIEAFVRDNVHARDVGHVPELSEAAAGRLEKLGYID
jgi:hypothetical protein